MTDTVDTNLNYCTEQLRLHDIDRYLSILLVPADKRDPLYALYAFNLEITKVRETVSEALLGEIRLTWWRESLEALYHGDVGDHPVLVVLERAIVEFALPQQPFLDLIDARRFDLYDEPMETMAQFEAYVGATSSLLFQLAAHIVVGPKSESLVDACGHIGVAYALQGLLRAAPLHASRGQLYLPKETMTLHKVEVTDYFSRTPTPELVAAFRELHDIAHYHLSKGQEALASAPDEAFCVFVPASLIKPYLKKIERAGFDLFGSALGVSQFMRQWKMWRAMQKRKLG